MANLPLLHRRDQLVRRVGQFRCTLLQGWVGVEALKNSTFIT
jgi:hypothetical protein